MTKQGKTTMTLKRFRAIVESYGASPGRWPADEREAAAAFLKNNANARALVSQGGGIDRALDSLDAPAKADTAFLKRLATIPHQPGPAAGRTPASFGGFLRGLFASRAMLPQGLGIAAAGLIGIWLGAADVSADHQIANLDAGQLLLANPDLSDDLGTAE